MKNKKRRCSFCHIRDARPNQWTCKPCHQQSMRRYRADKKLIEVQG